MTHFKILLLLVLAASCVDSAEPDAFQLPLQSRIELSPGSGLFNVQWKNTRWRASQTAVVICDMWDKHWCPNATARVAEMAPRMNEFICEARRRGALIIHCPSDTMDYYKEWPQYKFAAGAPPFPTAVPLERWRKLDAAHESALPIDDSDGGCDCAEPIKPFKAWSHQIDVLKIEPPDAITDTAQAYHLMRQRGIENVFVLGVHLNMCVLGRPFSIRQLVGQGMNVALVRDLTDALYNPEKAPKVSHFSGTDLMLQHVEKFWCPTVSSADVLGGKAFRFSADMRPRLLIISAEEEYKTAETLPKFALENLGKDFSVNCVFGGPRDEHKLQGLEQIKEADVVLLAMRRRILLKEQLELFRAYMASGKPVISVRTGVHAFAPLSSDRVPPDCATWSDFDKTVLGCEYKNHYSKTPRTLISPADGARENALFNGVTPLEFESHGTLYKVLPLDPAAVPLLIGTIHDAPPEPVAWTLTRPNTQRIFVTTLGHPDDFKLPQFKQLLKNAIDWCAKLPAK